MELADGMAVDLPSGFVPNGEAPETRSPLRKVHQGTPGCRLHVLCDVYSRLSFPVQDGHGPQDRRVHFSPAHWAKKAEKTSSRPTINSTDATSPYPVLNTEEVSEREG